MRHGCAAIAAGVIFAMLSLACVRADELPPLPVTPSATKVLILPALDETGDRAEMQREHTVVADHRIEYEFMTRGFLCIGPEEANRAARAEQIDLDDPDGRGENSLRTIGKDTGADWVVSAAIIDIREDKDSGLPILFSHRRAYAKIEIKVYDVHQDGYILNRFELQHKTTIRVIPGPNGIGTTGLFKDALDTAVQRSVANLLSPYPQTVHVDGEFSQDDLLDSPVATVPAPPPAVGARVDAPVPAVAPANPASVEKPSAAPAPQPTRFVKKDGSVVTGVIERYDSDNGLYFVQVPTGTTVVKASDIESMATVAAQPAANGTGK